MLFYKHQTDDKCSVPLKNVKAEVTVHDMAAEVNLFQTFKNETDVTIEAVYKFPLPDSAAVNAFDVELSNGDRVVGKVVKKYEASRIYKRALDSGDGAYLLDEITPEIFQLKVGNISPDEILTVHICYVQELPTDTLKVNLTRFSLPMTIAPRYEAIDSKPCTGTNIVYSEAAVEYTLSLDVKCIMNGCILGITSPTHKIATIFENVGGEMKVARTSLAEGSTYMDKDFVLLIEADDSDSPRAMIQYNPETGTNCVMLTLVPRFSLVEVGSELIFVVDCSGSMQGSKMTKTIEALGLFLHSLPRDCYFNVISYGSRFAPLFKESSKPYSASTLGQAQALLRYMYANMGGTEISEPLEWAFKYARKDMPTTVILLTDGQVNNTDGVIDLTREYVKIQAGTGLRVLTLGIGDSASHHLVNAVARVGRGYSQFIGEREGLENKVVQMLKNALLPQIIDYNIDWEQQKAKVEPVSATIAPEEIPVKKVISLFDPSVNIHQHSTFEAITVPAYRQTPQNIPAIIPHTRLFVYCFLAPGQESPKTLTLKGQSDNNQLEVSINVEEIESGSMVHTLAARKLIGEMEEGTSYLHISDAGDDLEPAESSIEAEIIALGTKFTLVSPYTSFVAVAQNDNQTSPPMQTLRIEVPSAAHSYYKPDDYPLNAADFAGDRTLRGGGTYYALGETSHSKSRQKVAKSKSVAVEKSASGFDMQDLHKLVRFQSYDGCFILEDQLVKFLGFDNEEVFLMETRPIDSPVQDGNVWTTLYVVAFLNKNMAEFKDAWVLVGKKAMQWVRPLIDEIDNASDIVKGIVVKALYSKS